MVKAEKKTDDIVIEHPILMALNRVYIFGLNAPDKIEPKSVPTVLPKTCKGIRMARSEVVTLMLECWKYEDM